jgi:hypothetical protein
MASSLRRIDSGPNDTNNDGEKRRTTMLPPPPDEAEDRSGLVQRAERRSDATDDVLAWFDEAIERELRLDVEEENVDDHPTIPISGEPPAP